ncbi:MAG TPA: ATP-binding protein [Micromonosporaceae bacterium]|nr:ATP-binding protein [Micromonosporaceae bacterium]
MPPTRDTQDADWPTPRAIGADEHAWAAANQNAAAPNLAVPLDVDWRTAGGTPIAPAKTVEHAASGGNAIPPSSAPAGHAAPGNQSPPWSGPPRPPRVRTRFTRTLTARAVVSTCIAALISVLVTAAVAFPLALRSANDTVRAGLTDKASLAASLINPTGAAANAAPIRAGVVGRQLRRQGVNAYVVHNGRSDPVGLPAGLIDQISAGHDIIGATRVIDGRRNLVEGRATGGGDGIVLIARAIPVTAGAVVARIGLALLAGLLAGLLVGALLARRLARPIRDAATVAARLSAGDRSVRLRPEPPAEAEDLAHAINALAAALASSEGRQREFLLSISHELRTPLTSLKGYAEALSDGVIGADGAQRAGATMLAEAGNLERLINDLLALARLEAADFPVESVPVELIHLVTGAAEGWAARFASAGIAWSTELPPVPVIVYTDPGRIRQVIDGLLENALRVLPAGAPIVLAVRGPAQANGGYGFVEVRDGGPGFTDADLAVVFERGALYERYRGVRKVGSGLGLALAAALVRRLGGHIEAGHAPEGGARFTVALPTLAATRRQRGR